MAACLTARPRLPRHVTGGSTPARRPRSGDVRSRASRNWQRLRAERADQTSLPAVPVTHIAEAAEFAIQYPRIELDITVSDHPVDLARREADIAVGVSQSTSVHPRTSLASLGRISMGYYVHRELLRSRQGAPRIDLHSSLWPSAFGRRLLTLGLKGRHLITVSRPERWRSPTSWGGGITLFFGEAVSDPYCYPAYLQPTGVIPGFCTKDLRQSAASAHCLSISPHWKKMAGRLGYQW